MVDNSEPSSPIDDLPRSSVHNFLLSKILLFHSVFNYQLRSTFGSKTQVSYWSTVLKYNPIFVKIYHLTPTVTSRLSKGPNVKLTETTTMYVITTSKPIKSLVSYLCRSKFMSRRNLSGFFLYPLVQNQESLRFSPHTLFLTFTSKPLYIGLKSPLIFSTPPRSDQMSIYYFIFHFTSMVLRFLSRFCYL